MEETKLPTSPDGDQTIDHADDQRKNTVLQVALRLFHERGYDKTGLNDIAAVAGITDKELAGCFSSLEEICFQVIELHLANQSAQFDQVCRTDNPRQRLSLYLDSLAENADALVSGGCPVTNLYFDVKREDQKLAELAATLLQQRRNWVKEQFVLMAMVAQADDLSERLTSAMHGISILAQAMGNARLIRRQVIQLKSWIRSM